MIKFTPPKQIDSFKDDKWRQSVGNELGKYQIVSSSSILTKTDTTLVDVIDLSIDLEAGRFYTFDAHLFVATSGGGGAKFAMSGTLLRII